MARQPDVQYIRFYTDGNAARKIAPAAPMKTIRLPKVNIKKKVTLYVDPIAVAGIFMAIVMLVLMTVGVVQLSNARKELHTMTAYVDTLQQEQDSLMDTYSQGYDLESVEKTALALGLVPKDTVKHVQIRVPQEQIAEAPGPWESFYIFLTGLFA